MFRSLLFVPGDNERMLGKAITRGSDGLIIDLEDAVSAERKVAAREITADFLTAATLGSTQLFVRVNALDTEHLLDDLVAIIPGRPSGIVLPKCRHRADLDQVAHYLDALEAREQMTPGSTRMLVLVTESAEAVANLATTDYAHPRVAGLMWGGEDLYADLGALSNRKSDGSYDDTFRMARSLTLVAAARAGVPAIDSVYVNIENAEGLEGECRAARREGFAAKCAIHPSQVEAINTAFTPTDEELAWARKVVEALSHGAGAVRVDGKMIDVAHLRLAERLLAS